MNTEVTPEMNLVNLAQIYRALNHLKRVAKICAVSNKPTHLRKATRFDALTVDEIIEELRNYFEQM